MRVEFFYWEETSVSVRDFMPPNNNALEPTPVGALSSAFAVDIIGPAWLSLGRSLYESESRSAHPDPEPEVSRTSAGRRVGLLDLP